MPYGSRTITVNGTAYKLNNLNVAAPVEVAQDKNPDGTPNRVRKTADVRTWSAELQLASASTPRPQFGDTFSAVYDPVIGSETYAFDPLPYEEDNSPTAIRVIKVTGWVVLNPSQYSVVS